jgi:hypothetical protein
MKSNGLVEKDIRIYERMGWVLGCLCCSNWLLWERRRRGTLREGRV